MGVNPRLNCRLQRIAVAALAAAAVLAPAAPAAGQSQCNSGESVIALLAKKYQESPVAIGVTSSGGLVEVLTTGDGNTWTIIVTTPQGMSCLVAAGEGWRAVEQAAAGDDS